VKILEDKEKEIEKLKKEKEKLKKNLDTPRNLNKNIIHYKGSIFIEHQNANILLIKMLIKVAIIN